MSPFKKTLLETVAVTMSDALFMLGAVTFLLAVFTKDGVDWQMGGLTLVLLLASNSLRSIVKTILNK